MVEFNPQYCPLQKKGTRKFQVNPAYIVNDSQFSDYLSRPVKLKTLTVKSIAKLFGRNPSFSHEEAASLPRDMRQEIFNVIERRSCYKPSKNSSQDVFQAWRTFFCSDKTPQTPSTPTSGSSCSSPMRSTRSGSASSSSWRTAAGSRS